MERERIEFKIYRDYVQVTGRIIPGGRVHFYKEKSSCQSHTSVSSTELGGESLSQGGDREEKRPLRGWSGNRYVQGRGRGVRKTIAKNIWWLGKHRRSNKVGRDEKKKTKFLERVT